MDGWRLGKGKTVDEEGSRRTEAGRQKPEKGWQNMKTKNIIHIIAALVFCLIASGYSGNILKEGFEDWTDNLKGGWETIGDVKVSTDQKHSGKKALFVPAGTQAEWKINEYEDKFGKVSFWAYDSKVGGVTGDWPSKNGPNFGLRNIDGRYFVLGFQCSYNHVWGNYFWCSTVTDGWRSWWWPSEDFKEEDIKKGWHKFVFNLPESGMLTVSLDDHEADIPMDKAKFKKGFSGLHFEGGKSGQETFYFDDIEVEFK